MRPTGTAFSTRYTEAGGLGDLVVAVQQGQTEVANRRGQTTTLIAGQQASFSDAVPRVTPILPVDRGSVVSGAVNTFSWTSFAGAGGYLLEYTFSPSGFARASPGGPESTRNTLQVGAGAFTQTSNAVRFTVSIPAGVAPTGTRVQWRVFPVDGAGQVLPGAVASDAAIFTLQ